MNSFFEKNFFITDITNICKVNDEIATSVHRNRPFHALVLFTKGQSLFDFQNGNQVLIKENHIIYLPKYSNYDSCDAENTECIAINFDILESNATFPMFTLDQETGEKYLPKFSKILRLWNEHRPGYVNGCLSALYDIIFQIQQDARRQYLPSYQALFVEQASVYINIHLDQPTLSVEIVAEELQITPEYLRRLFHAVKGISPMEYIQEKRIQLAQSLIASGDIKLNCISDACGFKEYAYFSRVFKKRVGLSPLQYAKSLR